MKQQLIDYLMQDRMTYIDMIELLRLPGDRLIRSDGDGILLNHGDLYLLAAEPGRAAAFLAPLTQGLQDDPHRMIILHSVELLDTLIVDYGFDPIMDCRHAIYPSDQPIRYTLPEGATIRRLDGSHLDFVHAHYHMVDDVDYIRERIEDGMFGAFMGEELVGFVGTHDERSMGLLEVLPDYRRLGLACALEAHLINHLLSLGRTPFCQVSILNEPSIALQKKLGMQLSGSVIHWLVRKQSN